MGGHLSKTNDLLDHEFDVEAIILNEKEKRAGFWNQSAFGFGARVIDNEKYGDREVSLLWTFQDI